VERLTASYCALLSGLLCLSLLGACSDDLAVSAPTSQGGAAGGETSGSAGITSRSDAGSGGVEAGASEATRPNGGTPSAGSYGGAMRGEPGWPHNPDDPRTESVPGGTVQRGWAQLDIGKAANYDGGDDPGVCPDPDEMVTPGTVDFRDGVWTLTGSGEGFIHGWDQGNLVYFKTKITGDFTFTTKVETFEMLGGKKLDGAAEALLNVREDLSPKRPTHSVIAGAAPNKFIFMARYPWEGENGKWWHWPAWPATWPEHRDVQTWTRLIARGDAISAETSTDGMTWQAIEHNDTNSQHPDWYPFRLTALTGERYVGLVCSARNDRNYAPLTQLPGKTVSCRDPQSEHLKGAARCVFSHVTLSQP
jgi:hypothetical protein